MPNIVVALKEEITRLARKEVKSQLKGLRKASAQYRRDVAELKRHAAKLKSEIGRLERHAGNGAAPAESEQGSVRYSAKSVRSQRNRLGMSAADYGKLTGVTGHTVYKWEHGTARPRAAQIVALASLRHIGRKEALARLSQMRASAPRKRAKRG
jgi:DNA-binding transcriptional regulator YiaG